MTPELRAAATLMERSDYAGAITAYMQISASHPEHAALCASQVGAAKFFLGEYADAITWYRKAQELGFPADMIADNIAEAEAAMASDDDIAGAAPFDGIDHGPLIERVLARTKPKKILAPPLPAKKERNAREGLPADARGEPILGLVDMTLFGSAKNALVLTAPAFYVVDDDKSWSFRWSELLGVDGYTNFSEDTIGLRLAAGTRPLYAGFAAKDVLHFLTAVVEERGVSAGGSDLLRHKTYVESSPLDIAYADDDRLGAHLERELGGEASVWHEVISDRVHLDIHMHAPTATRPYWMLVTAGLSALPMAAPEEDLRFAELCLALPPDWPLDQKAFGDERNYWPIRLLKTLARFPHDYGTWLGFGHSIPNGEPAKPYAPDVPYTGSVLVPGVHLDLEAVPGTPPIQIYQVLPVTTREMALKLDRGVYEMLAQLQEQCPDRFGPISRTPRVLR